jgi:hypothetical protein
VTSDPLRDALTATVVGLKGMIPEGDDGVGDTSFANLRWMADKCIAEMETFPPDKTSRWIGFIQGVLATKGHLSVADERDRTRPFFHEAYIALGFKPPVSVSR